jgi:hypothetical protein
LEWLNDGNFHRTRETASLQSDLEPLFHAIVEGLHDEMQWPGVDHRAELANVYPGIFHGVFFFSQEWDILAGQFIFSQFFPRLCLGGNDWEVYTRSPIYLLKEATSLMMNLLLLMVVLSSMDAFDAPTKPWRG